jgi:hypothetical protein
MKIKITRMSRRLIGLSVVILLLNTVYVDIAEARFARRVDRRARRHRVATTCVTAKPVAQPTATEPGPALTYDAPAVRPPERPATTDVVLVTGTLTLNAVPLTGGTIAFVTDDGTANSAEVADDGHFTMRLAPGDYTVTIRSASADENALPAKYSDPRTSDLRATVKGGSRNDFFFDFRD